jgi:hypothetical protein
MCVVSMVVDSARQQWPQPQFMPYRQAVDLSEVIEKLGQIDKKLGAKDCYDSKKDAYIQELRDRIAALEKELSK